MARYLGRLKALPGKPVFVAYPNEFDFLFVYWRLIRFTGESSFSHSAFDIKTYAMALLRRPYRESTKRNMPSRWFPSHPHTHVALDDAIEQGLLFCNMLDENINPTASNIAFHWIVRRRSGIIFPGRWGFAMDRIENRPAAVTRPHCGRFTDGPKQYRYVEWLVFFPIGNWSRPIFIRACPSCMRRIVWRRRRLNLIPANVLWPSLFLWGIVLTASSYRRGPSRNKVQGVSPVEFGLTTANAIVHRGRLAGFPRKALAIAGFRPHHEIAAVGHMLGIVAVGDLSRLRNAVGKSEHAIAADPARCGRGYCFILSLAGRSAELGR